MFDFIFNGQQRLNRSQYFIICMATFAFAVFMLLIIGIGNAFLSFLAILALIVNAVISAYAGVYRLHDLGHTGWMYLILLIPFVGGLFAIYMFFAAGQKESNQYGSQI